MKNLSKTLTAKEIRNLSLRKEDVMGFDFESGNHYILINRERIVSFTNRKDRQKSFDKINRMGFALGCESSQLSDEDKGLIQASKLGLEFPKALALYK